MRSALVVGSLFLVMLRVAAAWDEPDEFRGIPWNSPSSVVIGQLKIEESSQCSVGRATLRRWRCVVSFRFDEGVSAVFMHGDVWFLENNFSSVSVSFESTDFPFVEQVFIQRYGEPTRTRQEEVKTLDGETLVNRIDEWEGERVFVQLEQYFTGLSQAHAWVGTTADRRELLEQNKRDRH